MTASGKPNAVDVPAPDLVAAGEVDPAAVEREAIERVLTERAQALAGRGLRGPEEISGRGLLLFRVGRGLAGVELSSVREIFRIHGYAPVPDAHEWLAGVVSAHNEFLSLIDTRRLLKLPGSSDPDAPFTHALHLRHDRLRIALGCGEVLRLENIAANQWQEDRLFLSRGEVGALIDVDALLSSWEQEAEFNIETNEDKQQPVA
jgi:chemotaxis signal transduction protein